MNRSFLTLLFALVCFAGARAGEADYAKYFNPSTGFKPAQTNLTDIFLQIAGSLEHYGSPAPYLRHIAAEHNRVAITYETLTGKKAKSHRPAHMTNAYIEQLIANWELLSPKLKLDGLAKDAGMCAREAIRGTRDNGTILMGIFNRHQQKIASSMQGNGTLPGFTQLRSTLSAELEFQNSDVSMSGYEVARRDAVSYALVFRGVCSDLFKSIDSALAPAKAEQIKTAITSAFIDLGYMAQSELEIGILEKALR